MDIIATEQKGAENIPDFRHHLEGGRRRDLFQHRAGGIQGFGLILSEVGQVQIVPGLPLPLLRRFGAGEQPHQGRFAGAVGSDQGQALAALDLHFDLLQHPQRAIAMIDAA